MAYNALGQASKAFRRPERPFPAEDTSYLYQLVADVMGASSKQAMDLVKLKPAGPVARMVARYNSKGWQRELWTRADEHLVALIAVADVIHEMRIQPLSTSNEERLLELHGYNFLNDDEIRSSLRSMVQERDLLRELRSLSSSLPTMGKALASMGFFADLFGMSENTINAAAVFELQRRSDRNVRGIDAVMPILDRCITQARMGGLDQMTTAG